MSVAYGLRVQQSRPIYEGLVAIRDGEEWAKLDEAQKRCIELKIRTAEHAGVGLEGTAKERFNEFAKELSQISTDFSNHVLDATKAYELIIKNKKDTEGWPNSLRQVAAQSYAQANEGSEATPENGPWRITLDFPSFYPFMQHHRVRDHREQVYKAYIQRASSGEWDNSDLIARTLKLRQEQSALLGFATYADRSLNVKMAPDVASVERMIGELQAASQPHSEKDFGALEALAKESGQEEPVMHWDTSFWSERLREQKFDIPTTSCAHIFHFPKYSMACLHWQNAFLILRSHGQMMKTRTDGMKMCNSSKYSAMVSASRHFIWTPIPVQQKNAVRVDERLPGTAMAQRRTSLARSTPRVQRHATRGRHAIADEFSEVETLFHEFGHGLQGMLTTR